MPNVVHILRSGYESQAINALLGDVTKRNGMRQTCSTFSMITGLISVGPVIKVADFGLAEDMHSSLGTSVRQYQASLQVDAS